MRYAPRMTFGSSSSDPGSDIRETEADGEDATRERAALEERAKRQREDQEEQIKEMEAARQGSSAGKKDDKKEDTRSIQEILDDEIPKLSN